VKIGIPRALLYYWYGQQWADFWRNCGCEVVISPPTDPAVIQAGLAVAVDELCLPMKIFLGHAIILQPLVDRIMIPHLIKVEPQAYICPKFMGLPDIIAHTAPQVSAQAIVVQVGPRRTDQQRALAEAAKRAGVKPVKMTPHKPSAVSGLSPALQELAALQKQSHFKGKPAVTVGLLGHPYCLYDACFNLDLLQILTRSHVRFLTPEQMPSQFKGVGSGQLEKDLFWTIGRSQLDALYWMLHQEATPVDGLIQVTPFACGLEAIIGDLLARRIKQAGLPLLHLNFEEQSGEAGVITRLEAFLDLIKYRSMVC
jgi:predicted nucleotide-binding protein (sugar kinase/HSP70/actin superfamily)